MINLVIQLSDITSARLDWNLLRDLGKELEYQVYLKVRSDINNEIYSQLEDRLGFLIMQLTKEQASLSHPAES